MRIALLIIANILFVADCNTQEYSSYLNSKYGFSIQYPEGWILKEVSGYAFFINEPFTHNSDIMTNVTVRVTESLDIPLLTRLELVQLELNESTTFRNPVIIKHDSSTFKGENSIIISGRADVLDTPIEWTQIMLNRGELFFQITATLSINKSDSHESITDRIVHSFEWIE